MPGLFGIIRHLNKNRDMWIATLKESVAMLQGEDGMAEVLHEYGLGAFSGQRIEVEGIKYDVIGTAPSLGYYYVVDADFAKKSTGTHAVAPLQVMYLPRYKELADLVLGDPEGAYAKLRAFMTPEIIQRMSGFEEFDQEALDRMLDNLEETFISIATAAKEACEASGQEPHVFARRWLQAASFIEDM